MSLLKIDKKVIFFHMDLLIPLGTLEGKKAGNRQKEYIFYKIATKCRRSVSSDFSTKETSLCFNAHEELTT